MFAPADPDVSATACRASDAAVRQPGARRGQGVSALAKELDAVALTENRRQDAAWERGALDELRAGYGGTAVTAYRQAGRITAADTAGQARAQLVDAWWRAAATADGCLDPGGRHARAASRQCTRAQPAGPRPPWRVLIAGRVDPDPEQLAIDDSEHWRLHTATTNVGPERMSAAAVEAHHRLRGGIRRGHHPGAEE